MDKFLSIIKYVLSVFGVVLCFCGIIVTCLNLFNTRK